MVSRQLRLGKGAMLGQFSVPPWDKNHAQWQEIDVRLPTDHVARIIDVAVDGLDLMDLARSFEGRGTPPHRPDLMLKIALYEYHCGKPSPVDWFRDSRENDVVKWLGFGVQPSRTTWYEFRDRIAPFLDSWNQQVLHEAVEQSLTSARRAALDGTTVAACASRYKTVRRETLLRRIRELNEVIAQDEQGQPSEELPRWMAKHPHTRQRQAERYQRAAERMQQLQEENQLRRACKRQDPEKIRVSPTDPDAPLGRDKFKVFRPLYNVQIVRDLDSPLVLAYGTFQNATDVGTLEPMLERTVELCGLKPDQLLTDSAYATIVDLEICEQHNVTLYGPVSENDYSEKNNKKKSTNQFTQLPKTEFIWSPEEGTYYCPEGHRLDLVTKGQVKRFGGRKLINFTYRCAPQHCGNCTRQRQCTPTPEKGRSVSRLEKEELLDAHRARMETPEAKALYRLRGQTVEHGFADMKEHRAFRRICGRGIPRARQQVAATVLIHNLLAIVMLKQRAMGEEPSTTRVMAKIT